MKTSFSQNDLFLLMDDSQWICRSTLLKWYIDKLKKSNKFENLEEYTTAGIKLLIPNSDHYVPLKEILCNQEENICTYANVNLLSSSYIFVFGLDLSASVLRVDIPQSHTVLESLVLNLEKCLQALVECNKLNINESFQPKIYVSIFAQWHATSFSDANIAGRHVQHKFLVHCCKLSSCLIKELIDNVRQFVFNIKNTYAKQVVNPYSCSQQNILIGMLKTGRSSFKNQKANCNFNLVIITDGVIGMPEQRSLDNIIFDYHNLGISCYFLHVVSCDNDLCDFGCIPNLEVMQYVAATTKGDYLKSSNSLNHSEFINILQKRFLIKSLFSDFKQTKEALSPFMHRVCLEQTLEVPLFVLIKSKLMKGFQPSGVTLEGNVLTVVLEKYWYSKQTVMQYVITNNFDKNNVCKIKVLIKCAYQFMLDLTQGPKIIRQNGERKIWSDFRVNALLNCHVYISKELPGSDNVIQVLNSFVTNNKRHNVPKILLKGQALFYQANARARIELQANNIDVDFAMFWKFVLNNLSYIRKACLHSHSIEVILQADNLTTGYYTSTGSDAHYAAITCNVAFNALTETLKKYSDFILLHDKAYIKVVKKVESSLGFARDCSECYSLDVEEAPISFMLIELINRQPLIVVNVSFSFGTDFNVRKKYLSTLIKNLNNISLSTQQNNSTTKKARVRHASSKSVLSSINTSKHPLNAEVSGVVLQKPITYTLIRYDCSPSDLLSLSFLNDNERYLREEFFLHNKTNEDEGCFYMYHKRCVWCIEDLSYAKTLAELLVRLRQVEGYSLAFSSCGNQNMVCEIKNSEFLKKSEQKEKCECQYGSRQIQYIIFPPAVNETESTFSFCESEEADDIYLNVDVIEKPENYLAAEICLDPQQVMIENEKQKYNVDECFCRSVCSQFYNDLDMQKMTDNIFAFDTICLSAVQTLETLKSLCDSPNKEVCLPKSCKLPFFSKNDVNRPFLLNKNTDNNSSDNCSAIQVEKNILLYKTVFNFEALLEKFSYTEIQFSLLEQADINQTNGINSILIDSFNNSLKNLFNCELVLNEYSNSTITTLIYPEDPSNHQVIFNSKLKSLKWRCFLKKGTELQVLVYVVPATYEDFLTCYAIKESLAESVDDYKHSTSVLKTSSESSIGDTTLFYQKRRKFSAHHSSMSERSSFSNKTEGYIKPHRTFSSYIFNCTTDKLLSSVLQSNCEFLHRNFSPEDEVVKDFRIRFKEQAGELIKCSRKIYKSASINPVFEDNTDNVKDDVFAENKNENEIFCESIELIRDFFYRSFLSSVFRAVQSCGQIAVSSDDVDTCIEDLCVESTVEIDITDFLLYSNPQIMKFKNQYIQNNKIAKDLDKILESRFKNLESNFLNKNQDSKAQQDLKPFQTSSYSSAFVPVKGERVSNKEEKNVNFGKNDNILKQSLEPITVTSDSVPENSPCTFTTEWSKLPNFSITHLCSKDTSDFDMSASNHFDRVIKKFCKQYHSDSDLFYAISSDLINRSKSCSSLTNKRSTSETELESTLPNDEFLHFNCLTENTKFSTSAKESLSSSNDIDSSQETYSGDVPLFLYLSCTIKEQNSRNVGFSCVRTLPSNLKSITKTLEKPCNDLNLGSLKITLDLQWYFIPEINSNKNLPVLSCIKHMKDTEASIKWVVDDELMSTLCRSNLHSKAVLERIIQHVKSSDDQNLKNRKENCKQTKIRLDFCYGFNKSIEIFRKELKSIVVADYPLEVVGNIFYWKHNKSMFVPINSTSNDNSTDKVSKSANLSTCVSNNINKNLTICLSEIEADLTNEDDKKRELEFVNANVSKKTHPNENNKSVKVLNEPTTNYSESQNMDYPTSPSESSNLFDDYCFSNGCYKKDKNNRPASKCFQKFCGSFEDFVVSMTIEENYCCLYLHKRASCHKMHEFTEEIKIFYKLILNKINAAMKATNQILLLQEMYEKHECQKMLVEEPQEMIWTNYEEVKSTNLAASLKYPPGKFKCKHITEADFSIELHKKLVEHISKASYTENLALSLIKSHFSSFIVKNRPNMFVFKISDECVCYCQVNLIVKVNGINKELTYNTKSSSNPPTPTNTYYKYFVNINWYGVHDLSKKQRNDIKGINNTMKRKLEESALENLLELINRNYNYKLSSYDINLIQPRKVDDYGTFVCLDPPSEKFLFHLPLEIVNHDTYPQFVYYLHQHISNFLITPRYLRPSSKSGKFLTYSEYHLNEEQLKLPKDLQKMQKIYLYHAYTKKGRTGQGVACVSADVLLGASTPYNEFNDLTFFNKSKEVLKLIKINVQNSVEYKNFPEVKMLAHKPVARFCLWTVGSVRIDQLVTELKSTLECSLVDMVIEKILNLNNSIPASSAAIVNLSNILKNNKENTSLEDPKSYVFSLDNVYCNVLPNWFKAVLQEHQSPSLLNGSIKCRNYTILQNSIPCLATELEKTKYSKVFCYKQTLGNAWEKVFIEKSHFSNEKEELQNIYKFNYIIIAESNDNHLRHTHLAGSYRITPFQKFCSYKKLTEHCNSPCPHEMQFEQTIHRKNLIITYFNSKDNLITFFTYNLSNETFNKIFEDLKNTVNFNENRHKLLQSFTFQKLGLFKAVVPMSRLKDLKGVSCSLNTLNNYEKGHSTYKHVFKDVRAHNKSKTFQEFTAFDDVFMNDRPPIAKESDMDCADQLKLFNCQAEAITRRNRQFNFDFEKIETFINESKKSNDQSFKVNMEDFSVIFSYARLIYSNECPVFIFRALKLNSTFEKFHMSQLPDTTKSKFLTKRNSNSGENKLPSYFNDVFKTEAMSFINKELLRIYGFTWKDFKLLHFSNNPVENSFLFEKNTYFYRVMPDSVLILAITLDSKKCLARLHIIDQPSSFERSKRHDINFIIDCCDLSHCKQFQLLCFEIHVNLIYYQLVHHKEFLNNINKTDGSASYSFKLGSLMKSLIQSSQAYYSKVVDISNLMHFYSISRNLDTYSTTFDACTLYKFIVLNAGMFGMKVVEASDTKETLIYKFFCENESDSDKSSGCKFNEKVSSFNVSIVVYKSNLVQPYKDNLELKIAILFTEKSTRCNSLETRIESSNNERRLSRGMRKLSKCLEQSLHVKTNIDLKSDDRLREEKIKYKNFISEKIKENIENWVTAAEKECERAQLYKRIYALASEKSTTTNRNIKSDYDRLVILSLVKEAEYFDRKLQSFFNQLKIERDRFIKRISKFSKCYVLTEGMSKRICIFPITAHENIDILLVIGLNPANIVFSLKVLMPPDDSVVSSSNICKSVSKLLLQKVLFEIFNLSILQRFV